MAISWEGRIEWRMKAPFHVQLELGERAELSKMPGETLVPGRAVRVFRTDGRLQNGDRIAFTLWVCEPGDEPTGPAFIYQDAFVQAKYLEAYLCGSPPNCQLAAYEFAVLPFPTDEPTLTVEELQRSVAELQASIASRTTTAKDRPDVKRWWSGIFGK
jgi:hypothetical protein